LVHFLPKGKKRKWKQSAFVPRIAVKHTPTVRAEPLPENIPDPIRYFSRYLDDDFFESMALFTNMKEVKQTGKSLDTSAAKLKVFFACSILIGIYNLPRIRMYWQQSTRVPIICENISRNQYFALRTRLKIVDDNAVSKKARENDRFWKIRPMIDRIQRACLQNERTNEISVDEQMIPFHGKVRMRQFVQGKPHPVGLKNFVMTTSKGIPLDLQMYEGKGKSTESCLVLTPEKLDVGGRVALRLADTLPVGVSLFTDRFFTSIPLIETLLARGITLTGTLMKNRIPKEASFRIDNQMKKSGRGSYDMLVTENNKIALVKWYDSKPVHIGSSEFGTQPVGLCNRWSKVDNKYLEIQRPSVVKSYNENMGGVDLLDRVISNYRMKSRTTKWTIRAIYHFVDFSAAAGLLEYQEDAEAANVPIKEKLDYLDFKFSIAKALLSSGLAANPQNSNSSDSEDEEAAQLSRKRRRVEAIPEKRIRKKESKHLPHFIKDKQKSRSKCRYPGCKKLTFAKCSLCNVFLCCSVDRNCFMQFHQ
jgi:hypothetical protein